MQKSIFSIENILSILIALVLATVLFFGLRQNFDKLQANVLGEQQDQLLWDVIVDTYADRIELVLNKKIPNLDSMSIMVFWDTVELDLDTTNIQSKWNLTDVDSVDGRASIFVNQLDAIKQKDVLLEIPASWDVTQITVSDAVLLFLDGSSEKASISTR